MLKGVAVGSMEGLRCRSKCDIAWELGGLKGLVGLAIMLFGLLVWS